MNHYCNIPILINHLVSQWMRMTLQLELSFDKGYMFGFTDIPIYACHILNKAKKNYNTTKKELLVILWAVNKFVTQILHCYGS